MINILINDLSHTKLVIRDSTVARIKYWQQNGCKISILTSIDGKKFYGHIFKKINFLIVDKTKFTEGKFTFIVEALKRNFLALKFIRQYQNKFDVVFSISSVLDLLIFPFIFKIKNPNVIWCAIFDNKVPLKDPGNKIVRFLAWIFFNISLLLLHKIDFIFAISSELKEYLIRCGFDPLEIVVTGNAIENDLIKKSRSSKNKYDGIFVGRINKTKGIFDMLDVIKKVKKEIPSFKLAVMGDGDTVTKNKFKNKIKSLKLSKNIILLGTKKGLEKFSIIKSSKIFIFLSKSESESFGIALLEAVSCGLPAFVYDLPAYKNIYKNNEINKFKTGDINSISEAIIKTFKNKQFKNENGKKLLGKYNWETIAKIEFNTFKKAC